MGGSGVVRLEEGVGRLEGRPQCEGERLRPVPMSQLGFFFLLVGGQCARCGPLIEAQHGPANSINRVPVARGHHGTLWSGLSRAVAIWPCLFSPSGARLDFAVPTAAPRAMQKKRSPCLISPS